MACHSGSQSPHASSRETGSTQQRHRTLSLPVQQHATRALARNDRRAPQGRCKHGLPLQRPGHARASVRRQVQDPRSVIKTGVRPESVASMACRSGRRGTRASAQGERRTPPGASHRQAHAPRVVAQTGARPQGHRTHGLLVRQPGNATSAQHDRRTPTRATQRQAHAHGA